MKVLFTSNYGEEKFQMVRDLGYEVIYCAERKVENNDETNSADILVTYDPFGKLNIDEMKKLKYIQLTSIGIDQVPKEKLLSKNILLANNKGAYSIPIGEWIVLYILQVYKDSSKLYRQQLSKQWTVDFSVEELYRKKVGFLGTGTIATEAAKRLRAFEMEIWGVNTNGSKKEYFDKCFSKNNMDEVFKYCDVIVVTMPSTEDTTKLINDDKFKIMKEGSLFINVGRGNIVEEDDLIKNISKFKGVALDVFDKEPLSKESKLWECDNVIITPHNSWISNRNKERTFNTIYSNLKKYNEGEEIINKVDICRGY